MSWFDDKKLLLGVNAIGLNSLKKKKKKPYIVYSKIVRKNHLDLTRPKILSWFWFSRDSVSLGPTFQKNKIQVLRLGPDFAKRKKTRPDQTNFIGFAEAETLYLQSFSPSLVVHH